MYRFPFLKINFGPYLRYRDRERPLLGHDVPYELGTPAVYAIARFPDGPPPPSGHGYRHLMPQVIYIGCSARGVEQRLEFHEIAAVYRDETGDHKFEYLYYCVWDFEGPLPATLDDAELGSRSVQCVVMTQDFVRFAERLVICEYSWHHRRRPKYNRW